MSYQEIESQSKVAADFLLLCCFFAPNGIPICLLTESSEIVQEPLKSVLKDDLLLDDTLEILLNYSLIERKEDCIFIHSLVQLILRDCLEEPLKERMNKTTLKIIRDSLQFDCSDFNTWPKVLLILPHALVTINIAESLSLAVDMRGFIFNQLGIYFNAIGDYETATKTFKNALDAFKNDMGLDDPIYAKVLNNYVLSLRNVGDINQLHAFVTELEKSLETHINTFGSDSPEVAPAHNAIGLVLRDIGGKENLIEAEKHFLVSYFLNREHAKERPKRFSTDLSNIATIKHELGGTGNLISARIFIEEALDIDEKYLEHDDPVYAIHLINYALILQDLGRELHQNCFFESANTKLREAYRILFDKYGDKHPETMKALENLQNSEKFLTKLKEN